MQSVAFSLCALLALMVVTPSVASSSGQYARDLGTAKGSAVAKVISMLEDMKAKGEQEMQDEKVRFASFAQFCEGAEKEKVRAIEASTKAVGALEGEIDNLEHEIEQLGASIAKADSDIANLQTKIKTLDNAMKQLETDEEEITEERTEEHDEFEKKDQDLAESVDALDRAVTELKSQDVEHAQSSLLEVMSKKTIEAKYKNQISSYLRNQKKVASYLKRDREVMLQKGERAVMGGPQADAYEFQSEGVVNMFEDIEGKMEGERADGQKQEFDRKHSYDMLMMDLENQLERSKDERAEDVALKAEKEQRLSEAKGEKADTQATLDEDEKYLKELKAMCKQKTAEFEQRQELRQGELQAIAKAVEIMNGAPSGGALVQKPSTGSSFVQLRASGGQSVLQRRVSAFLQERATHTNSKFLALVADKIAADPFGKVKKMINDMLTKLMEEAQAAAEQKAWCDKEMNTNRFTRDKKTEAADKLSAEIEMLEAKIAKTAEEITDLEGSLADTQGSVAEMTSMRQAEKAKNAATSTDAKAAETATAQAMTVLKEFYAKAGTATALMQSKGPAEDAPETFTAPYQGNQDQAGGVIGLLEVIQSDFANLLAETTAAEEASADAFEKFSADARTQKLVTEKDIKYKQTTKQEATTSLEEAKTDLATTQDELIAAMDYYNKLKPTCIDEGESFEDGQARRKEEVESLQEALKILEDSA